LSQAEYADAGFLGDVPPRAVVAQRTVRNWDTLVASLVFLTGYLVAALVLGLLKAVSPYSSHWLWMTVGSGKRNLDAYKEPELRPRSVIRDARGYCVHPITKSRHIRLLDSGQEFIANALFFVSLPTAVCRYYSVAQEESCYALSTDRKARDDSSEQASGCDLQQRSIYCDSQKLLESNNSSECIE